MNNILHSSETTEWFTPKRYIDVVKKVFGGKIDLDPASCAKANNIVQAERYFSLEKGQNGLEEKWGAKTVWLNPPYGSAYKPGTKQRKSNQWLWSTKMIEEFNLQNFKEGILLVNAVPSNRWFMPLFKYPICFTNHRIHFIDEWGYESEAPTHSNCFVYFGDNYFNFKRCFADIGTTVMKV